jgi:CubicO group peptidase (beta-lactamase class C family)
VSRFAGNDFDCQLRASGPAFVNRLLLLSCLLAALLSASRADDKAIVGLWRSEQIIASPASGQLIVDGKRSPWRASNSGRSALVQRNEEAVTFTLPNGAGEFRGRLIGGRIIGHWIQPANGINDSRYATPVELASLGEKEWGGRIETLNARLTLYLSIERAGDGSLTAVIRNPEFNQFHRKSFYIELRGGAVTLSDAKDPNQKFEGSYDEKTDRLSILLPNFEKQFEFTQLTQKRAAEFFPRVADDQNYVYRKPIAENDGWSTASLSDVGLDLKPISELIGKILHVDPANNALNVQGLLIARHGKLVLEEYFYGFNKDRLHDMRSASKTFAPLLVGIARDHGAKIDIDTPAYAQFPEYKEFANSDPRKAKITVRDLMTMTSGLACDDNDENSLGSEDVMQQQTVQTDWYKYTLDLPVARDPGGDRAVYCSAGMNLLGAIVRNATHTWLPEFFYENVAKPLQIKTYHWNLMPSGDGYAGGGLYLRPRDQLKLGQLYLSGGVWNGKRLVSKDWVEKSISQQSTFGKTLGADHDYGYAWHLYHFEVGDHSYRVYAAGGNGGQIVMVIPDLDLVVGFTGGAYGEFAKWYKWQTELVPECIIPAAASVRQTPP